MNLDIHEYISIPLVHTFSIANLVATEASSSFMPQSIVNSNKTADLNIIFISTAQTLRKLDCILLLYKKTMFHIKKYAKGNKYL
jgi:hypothetical protein